jgi:hypothetical protein
MSAFLPVLSRDWQYLVNQTIAGHGTLMTQNQNLWFAVKQALLGVGSWKDSDNVEAASSSNWVVVASCDGSTVSHAGVDKWVTASNLVWPSSGARAWIVLRQTGIAAQFQLMIELLYSTGAQQQFNVRVSHSGFGSAYGGVDGTTTAAPTALNSVLVGGTAATCGAPSTTNTATVLHVIKSADGTSTRVLMCRGSACVLNFFIELPANAVSGWSHPYAAYIAGSASATEAMNFATVCRASPSNPWVGVTNGGTSLQLITATIATNDASTAFPAFYTTAGNFSGGYGFFDIVLGGNTATGLDPKLGILADMYFGLTAHVTGIGYPSVAVDADRPRQWVKVGPWIVPWNNTIVVTS